MKREHMVKYMLQEYAASHRGGMSEMTDEERMDYLLTKMQEVGMLAPYREKTEEEKQLIDAINQFNYCHRWDKE